MPEIKDGIVLEDITATKQMANLIKSDDSEVQLSLNLIDKYGIPKSIFGFAIPDYNTQLQVLYWLEKNI